MSVESPFRQHTQFDLEQGHKMNDDIPSRYWREARGRYEVSYLALKHASPAEQPRELIDRIPMSAPSSAQPREAEVCSGHGQCLGRERHTRKALPQLHEVFDGRDQRRLRLLAVGCGTGRFLDFVKQPWR